MTSGATDTVPCSTGCSRAEVTRTDVYAYRPDRIRSAASFQAQQAVRTADHAAEQRANEAFRRDLAIGTETNCGTAIQLRGPMVEVAVPPVRLTPNGQLTLWSKGVVSLFERRSPLTPHPRPCPHVSVSPSDPSSYLSADPATDLRRLFAGSKWNASGTSGLPVSTVAGEWMIPVIIDLPYPMLTSLEAAAQSEDIGDIIRAALVAAGHGTPDDIAGVRSDRFATLDERREIVGTTRL